MKVGEKVGGSQGRVNRFLPGWCQPLEGRCSVSALTLGAEAGRSKMQVEFSLVAELYAPTMEFVASSPANPRGNTGRSFPVHWPTRQCGNQSEIVFVTVCAQNRKRILSSKEAVATIVQAWEEANAWLVGRYVIMPDHIHLFCSPYDPGVSVKRWVQFWKSRASQHWPHPGEQPIWQRDCWDVQLRRDESYSAKWEYVRNYPVRHGFVANAEDWPWAGEIAELMWHEP